MEVTISAEIASWIYTPTPKTFIDRALSRPAGGAYRALLQTSWLDLRYRGIMTKEGGQRKGERHERRKHGTREQRKEGEGLAGEGGTGGEKRGQGRGGKGKGKDISLPFPFRDREWERNGAPHCCFYKKSALMTRPICNRGLLGVFIGFSSSPTFYSSSFYSSPFARIQCTSCLLLFEEKPHALVYLYILYSRWPCFAGGPLASNVPFVYIRPPCRSAVWRRLWYTPQPASVFNLADVSCTMTYSQCNRVSYVGRARSGYRMNVRIRREHVAFVFPGKIGGKVRGIARNLFRRGTKPGDWGQKSANGSRGRAMLEVWGQSPQKLKIYKRQ